MCVKLLSIDLHPDPYLPYPISTYLCKMTITPRVYGSVKNYKLNEKN